MSEVAALSADLLTASDALNWLDRHSFYGIENINNGDQIYVMDVPDSSGNNTYLAETRSKRNVGEFTREEFIELFSDCAFKPLENNEY